MNRADQAALYQATNQGLISIRQLEINYYLSLNVAFGTQAALIGGFSYGVFSQNPINENTPNVVYIADAYWILSAITIAFSVHVILCTMMMQVLGPGLALNGPIGSMAIATEGMRIEQKQITRSFTYMMVFFAISTTMSFWQTMEYEAAAISTFAFIVASRYWYYYCERIYLRFYWDRDANAWEDKEDDGYLQNESDPADRVLWSGATNPLAAGLEGAAPVGITDGNRNASNTDLVSVSAQQTAAANTTAASATGYSQKYSGSISQSQQQSGNSRSLKQPLINAVGDGDSNALEEKKKKKSLLRFMTGSWKKKSDISASELSSEMGPEDYIAEEIRKSASLNDLRAAMASTRETAKGVQMEGYLTMRGMTKELRRQPWRRRYFTLTSSGQLFCYKSRQEYRADPKAPVFTRPFLLSDHFVRVDNMDEESRSNAAGAGAFDDFDNFTELDGGASELDGPTAGAFAAAGAMPMRASMTIPRLDGTAADTSTAAGGAAGAAVEKKMKPYRFQIALAPRENEELQQGNTNQHRNWIVLRCDTEEELLIWVGVMQEISPSSFGKF